MTHPILMRAAAAIALAALVFSAPTATRVAAQGDANQLVPPNAFKDLKWRSVGATRGGRVTAYSGVRQQPHTFYFGGVGGGVWKTDDAGITWVPISDGQITSTGSIGSIDVAPSNPESRVGRHRQRRDPLERDHRPRRLQVDRRRQQVGVHGPQGLRADRRHQGPSVQHQHGVARGARLAVRSERRARHLQDHRRRQDVEEDAVREQRDRRPRHRSRLGESRHPLRGDVSRLPQGLGHHQRRSRQRRRHLQVHRRRRDVEEDQRRPAVRS